VSTADILDEELAGLDHLEQSVTQQVPVWRRLWDGT
jgi:hypothetical protein